MCTTDDEVCRLSNMLCKIKHIIFEIKIQFDFLDFLVCLSFEKKINYMSNRKDLIIHLIAGLIKMMLYKNESILS